MADCFGSVILELRSKVGFGRCLFTIIIFLVVILADSKLDARIIKKEFKRNSNADSPQTDLTLPCDKDPVVGIPIDLQVSPNKINVALTYNEIDFPYRPFELILFEGNSHLNCEVVTCVRRVGTSRKIFGKSYIYENLTAGYYCARLKYKTCLYMSRTEHVRDPYNNTNTEVSGSTTSEPQEWVYFVLGASVSFIAIVAVIVLRICKPPKPPGFKPIAKFATKPLYEAIKTGTPVPVFLLYNYDCSHHLKVVMKLAEFLEKNNCEVSCEYREKHEIVVNKIGWIHNKLTSNFKILLVNSKMAYVKQKLWLNNKESRDETSPSDDVFLHSLAIISHRIRQSFDYKNLYMLLPSYVSKEYVLSNICPGKHYKFPRYLAVLLCHLHNVDLHSVDFEEPGVSWEHCSSAYEELCCLVNSMTAYDDRGNVITGCKQCDPQVISTKLP